MLDFKPPQDNAFVIALGKIFLPAILRYKLNDVEIKIVGDGLERFKTNCCKRTVICPNHAHRHDPEVMFAFSKLAGEDFNFIAAREIFDWNHGLNGWLLQKLGCYSVVRGACDRESFRTTKALLVAGKKKLVLFPEGEISQQNDTLLPLESGAIQLSFWALDELQNSSFRGEPLMIQPLAIKYTFKNDITNQLSKYVLAIEQRLGLEVSEGLSLYERLRSCAEAVLRTLEDEYNCKPTHKATLNERMQVLKTEVLKTMADVLAVNLPQNGCHLDWVRLLRNTMDDFIYGDAENMSAYQKKIHEEKASKIKAFYRDLDRVISFIAIYDGYLSPPVTQERFANVVDLLVSEVFGKVSIKSPRQVFIDVGEPINLLDYYLEYKNNKKDAIARISCQITKQISSKLMSLDTQRRPVYVI